MTHAWVLSTLMAEVLSDDIKYLSNSSLRLADFLNKAARDDIGIGLNTLDWGLILHGIDESNSIFLFYFHNAYIQIKFTVHHQ